jgi:nitroreductase
MNQVLETIIARRSVRFYKPDAVPREAIEQIIAAGNQAPTGTQQQWRFVVAISIDFRKKLADLARPRYEKWMLNAPEAFKARRAQIDKVAKDPAYYSAPAVVFVIGKGVTADADCAMVCENMMLAATSLGLGSCWVYFGQLPVDDADIKAALELSEGEKVFGPILLGYPADNLPPRAPKKPPTVKWV